MPVDEALRDYLSLGLGLDHVQEQQMPVGVGDAARRIEQGGLHFRRLIHDDQELAFMALLEYAASFCHGRLPSGLLRGMGIPAGMKCSAHITTAVGHARAKP